MINKILKKVRERRFRKLWRSLNSHNQTMPNNIFPIEKVKIGKSTYGYLNIRSWDHDDEALEVGNYCSIANGVSFILGGEHKIDCLFTFPFKVELFNICSHEAITKGKIIVEDDVWIGTNATILSGVKIGKGSIIGADAVIAKNIEPFSIVIGNPSKVIRKRFSADVIEYLLNIDYSALNFLHLREKNIDYLYEKINTLDDAKKMIACLSE